MTSFLEPQIAFPHNVENVSAGSAARDITIDQAVIRAAMVALKIWRYGEDRQGEEGTPRALLCGTGLPTSTDGP
jgi:hypothetical protein